MCDEEASTGGINTPRSAASSLSKTLRALNIKSRGRKRATVVLETLGAMPVETKLDMRSAPGKRVILNFEDACISHVKKGVLEQVQKDEENNSYAAIPRRMR